MPIMTGLSGNEIYCLNLKNLLPGELVVGNSVHSMGFVGGVRAGLNVLFGGEVTQVTEIISEGRHEAQKRLVSEAERGRAHGITGVTSELRRMQGNVEFLSVGSCLHAPGTPVPARALPRPAATARSCSPSLIDAGYTPQAPRDRQRGVFGGRGGRPVRGAQEPRPRRDQGIQRHLQRHPAPGACAASAPKRGPRAPMLWWGSRPASCRFAACTRC